MKSFAESGYNFEFSDEWNVIKYDDHRFYKLLSGHDMSGVDFAGIRGKEALFFIEIKNFDQHKSDQMHKPIDEFVNEIIEKGNDCIRLIRIIKKYLERKFWYKAFFNLVNRFTWLNPEWHLWTEFYRIAILEKKAVFVLLIDSHYDKQQIETRLKKELLSVYSRVIVESISDQRSLEGVSVF